MPTKPKIPTNKWAATSRSRFVKSPHFETIMKQYDAIGTVMPVKTFWREHVYPIDNAITFDVWKSFIKNFKKNVTIDASKILEKSENKLVNAILLEEKTLNKMAVLFDMTLDEIIQDPEKMKQIPVEMRARWFFSTMRARDARLRTGLKKRADDREQTAYDEMMEDAQYNDDAIDIDASESEIAQDMLPEQVEEIREQIQESIDPPPVIAFNPETDIDSL